LKYYRFTRGELRSYNAARSDESSGNRAAIRRQHRTSCKPLEFIF